MNERSLGHILSPSVPQACASGTLATGRTVSISVGLKEGEVAELDAIAYEHGVARNALHRYAVAEFLRRYRGGEAAVEFEEAPVVKRRLRMT